MWRLIGGRSGNEVARGIVSRVGAMARFGELRG